MSFDLSLGRCSGCRECTSVYLSILIDMIYDICFFRLLRTKSFMSFIYIFFLYGKLLLNYFNGLKHA